MSSIKKALINRDKGYYDKTQEIFSLFSEKLNKAVQYFIKIDRDIFWISVEFIQGVENFVYVSGILEVGVGDIVVIDNSKIEVNEEFLKNNSTKTLVRIMFNVDDLEQKTPKELFEKIKDYYSLCSVMSEVEIIRNLNTKKISDLAELLDLDNVSVTPSIPEEKNVNNIQMYEFDTSLLNEDQIKQMRYHSQLTKIKN